MINFLEVPATNFSPGAHVEPSQGGGASQLPRTLLLVGYSHGATPGPLLERKPVPGTGHPWPRGSQIARMIKAVRDVNANVPLDAVAIDDPAAGASASAAITVTGPATADGAIEVYVADARVSVAVSEGDSATDVAAAIAAAIEAAPDAPANASSAAAVLTVTAKTVGVEGNHIIIDFSPKGGQEIPAGLGALVRTPLAGGTGSGDITTALAPVMGRRYFSIASGLSDSTSVVALADEMARRWQATVELHGQGFISVHGETGAQALQGEAINRVELTVMGAGLSLSPQSAWAAAAAASDVGKTDTVVGWLGRRLPGLDSPEADYTNGERNLLLQSGVSTFRASNGNIVLDRLVTNRTKDLDNNTDLTQLALTRRRTLEFLAFNWRSRVYNKYLAKNFGLADADDVVPTEGSRRLTPTTMMTEAVAWFTDMRDGFGAVQNVKAFIAALNSEINGGDVTRIDNFLAPKLQNELVTIATAMEAR